MKTVEDLKAEIAALQEKMAPAKARLQKLITKLHVAEAAAANAQVAEWAARENELTLDDWRDIMAAHGGRGALSPAAHQFRRELIQRLFSMQAQGYYSETDQTVVDICVEDSETRDKNLAGVKHFVKVLRPHASGFVTFGVFESTLGEYGSYSLHVRPDLSELFLRKTAYSRTTDLQKFTTPEAALDYVARNYPYRR